MDIILKERGHGKTENLIYLSSQTGIPIVCMKPEYVIQRANELRIQIPNPLSPQELSNLDEKPQSIYIDEMSIVLKKLLNCSIAGFTDTV